MASPPTSDSTTSDSYTTQAPPPPPPAGAAGAVAEAGKARWEDPIDYDRFTFPQEGDTKRGMRLFKKHCAQCHSIYPNNRGNTNSDSGPTLWNVHNRSAGCINHNRSYQSLEESGIVWTEANLMRYMFNPGLFVERNVRMNFVGIRSVKDRLDILHYIKTLNYLHPDGRELLERAQLSKDTDYLKR
eukprot:GHVQ01041533.1.p1 GENE.GHVQ01041533.1~~GHVQ01041533.1.p1  ORF type:complete len:186 (-),score=41.35 GHVQ01041533.1:262-819(-)